MSAKKFEQLINLIINEDKERAEQLFHEIVVEKSREIYESIIDEDQSMGLLDEIESEDQGMGGMMEADEEFETDEEIDGDYDVDGEEEDFSDEEGEEDEFDMDDMEDEEDMDAMDDEEELEDRVVDLEDKLDQLMADFEAQMGGDGDGEEEEIDVDAEVSDEEDELMENVKLTKIRGLYDAKIGGDDGEVRKSPVAANSGKRGMQGKPVNYDVGPEESQASGPKKPSSYVTKSQKEIEGAKSFKNVAGGTNFTAKGETTPKPVKTQQSGTNTRSAVPESKRTTKKRI